MGLTEQELSAVKPRRGGVMPWLLLVLVLAGAGAGGWFLWQALEAEKVATAQAQKALAETSQQALAGENAKNDLIAKLASVESEAGLLRARVDELDSTVKEREGELAKLKSTYDSLEDKLTAEIKKGEIRVSQSGGRLQVDLVDKILFDSGKADLSDRGKEVLGKVGAILATIQDKQIQVSGHTDDSPIADKQLKETFPTNWELSAARAVNVVRYLAEEAKVPAKRLLAAGYGEHHPVADNANAAGRARNRRIEILLTPALDAKPGTLPAPPEAKGAKPDPKAAKAVAKDAKPAKGGKGKKRP